MFPSKLRKALGEGFTKGLVINRDIFEKCIVLYPEGEWKIVNQELAQLSRYSRKHQNFHRNFMIGASDLEPDKSGRILIPSILLEKANIDPKKNNEVVVSGMGQKIEIWATDMYDARFSGEDEGFGDEAEEIGKDIENKNLPGLN